MTLGIIPIKGAIDLSANLGTNAADGVDPQDLATVAQVAVGIANQSWKNSVRLATVGAHNLATDFVPANNVDDVALVLNDRILIKNQVAAVENGIYIVQAAGAPIRASDFLPATPGTSASAVKVEEGVVNVGAEFFVTTTGNPVPGTDDNNWALSLSAGFLTVIENRSPAASTVSPTFVTLATSAVITFSGDPVLFFLSLSAFCSSPATEVELAIVITGGPSAGDNVISHFMFDTTNIHSTVSGMVILSPTSSAQTITLKWRRPQGIGTIEVNGADQLLVNAIRN